MSESGVSIEKARDHLAQGETALATAIEISKEIGGLTTELDLMNAAVINVGAMAAMATAHFTAAQAIVAVSSYERYLGD